MTFSERPHPQLDGLTGEFYAWCALRELRFQRCAECQKWRHPPRFSCATCGSNDWSWEKSSGRGKVFTWTVVHQALHPAFAESVPYAVVVVETEEGVRIVTNIKDIGSLQLGLAVTVDYETYSNESDKSILVLPIFKS